VIFNGGIDPRIEFLDFTLGVLEVLLELFPVALLQRRCDLAISVGDLLVEIRELVLRVCELGVEPNEVVINRLQARGDICELTACAELLGLAIDLGSRLCTCLMDSSMTASPSRERIARWTLSRFVETATSASMKLRARSPSVKNTSRSSGGSSSAIKESGVSIGSAPRSFSANRRTVEGDRRQVLPSISSNAERMIRYRRRVSFTPVAPRR